jgi:signal peptidase II
LDRAPSRQLKNRQRARSTERWPRAMQGRVLFVLVAVIVFIADRISKGLVVANVQPGTEKPVLPHVWITNTQNPGAAFGVAQDATAVFLVASVLVTVGLIFYVARNPVGTWAGVLLGLILGGTVGNGYDRLLHGTVTDFIALHFWPVFNVADSAISIGVVIVLLGYVIRQRSGSSG